MELFSFLLFIMTGLFFYTRGDLILRQNFKTWKHRFMIAKTLGFKNILRACYKTISMLCFVLMKTCLLKLNKRFGIENSVGLTPLTAFERDYINRYRKSHGDGFIDQSHESFKYYKLSLLSIKLKYAKLFPL